MKSKILLSLIVAGLMFGSCDKTVEIQPQNSVTPEVALSDATGYQALLISVYDRLQSYTYWGRDMALMGDALGDNIYTVTSQSGNRYNSQNVNTKSAHYNIWTNAYAAINELNIIIDGIDKLTNIPTSQVLLQAQVKAEALVLRGMIYFDLARIYGYEPTNIPTTGTNANFDKSVVLRLTPTKLVGDAQMVNRSTVVQAYTQIEKDLKAGIAAFVATKAIAGYAKPTNPYRVTESYTHALLGKVYLYWGKNAQAVTEFDAAFDATILVARQSTVGNIAGDWKKVPHPESLFELNYVQSVEVTGVTGSNDGLFTYTQPTGLNASNVATFAGQTVSAELLALYETADDRKALIFNSKTSTSGNTAYNWMNKYNGSNGPFTDNTKIMRYSDVLLMKAEALANQTLYLQASAIVVQLRTQRNATVVGVPVDATILPYIQNERRRELAFEGHRWFDLKRIANGITKPAATAVAVIPATDSKLLAPIPSGEVTLNPALPQNPTY